MEQPPTFEKGTYPETSGLSARVLAILEVVLVFAAVHVSYRALQTFTSYGRWEVSKGINFISGAVMILTTLGILYIRKSNFRTYGLSLTNWKVDLRIGLIWLFVAGLIGGVLAYLSGVRESFSGRNPPSLKLGMATLAIKMVVATLFTFVYRRKLPNAPSPSILAVIVGLFLLFAVSPLPAALYVNAPLLPTLLDVLWMGVFCGSRRRDVLSRLHSVAGQ